MSATHYPSHVTAHRIVVLIGAEGMLAQKVKTCCPEDCDLHSFDLPGFDLTSPLEAKKQLRALNPSLIINCAAYTDVDGCESNAGLAMHVNGDGPGVLAETAVEMGATLVHVSTDYVFDGTATRPYLEDETPAPRSVYGRSKLAGERAIQASELKRYYIVRTSWLYGPGGKNFVGTMVRLGSERDELRVVADQRGCPTYTGDLAKAIFALLKSSAPYGTYHFANRGECSWHEFAEAILAEAARVGAPIVTKSVVPIGTEDYPLPAPRPAYSVLSKEKFEKATGMTAPDWRESLKTFFNNDWRA